MPIICRVAAHGCIFYNCTCQKVIGTSPKTTASPKESKEETTVKTKRILSALMAVTMTATLAACGSGTSSSAAGSASGETSSASESASETGEVKEFTMFSAVPGSEINDDNEVQQLIADITGVKVKETWLTGQTASEAIGTLIAGGEYPDFIDGSDATQQLYDAGALIAIDEYWDDYPNIKNFWSEADWDKVRRDDGHIYWIPQFGRQNGEDMTTIPDEAFWIQTRVLEWAGYPTIETMDEYFDLIESYYEANPTMEDGTANIPYTILCDDWRYFCLENAPQFLDGYPNDGSVIVDTDTMTVVDYNTTDTAQKYFRKLNEEYQKGIVDPESFTQTYDEYIAKLSSGRVLGMVDQYWDFGYTVTPALQQAGLDAQGCDYVPLGLTIEKGMHNQWYTGGSVINSANGLGITVSCQDVEGALQFVNDLLGEECETLRHWGVEGVDYLVDDNGLYYRTDEMRDSANNTSYKASHLCSYSYFPTYEGMNPDGINAATPDTQPTEFFESLSDDVQKCFEAYGVSTYVEMLGKNDIPGIWFPMYSHSNNMTTATAGGTAWTKMGETKHQELPKVVMAEDFDSAWESYMEAYSACKPEDFLAEMQEELDNRVELGKKYAS